MALNNINIMGRLTANPELRRTGTGKAVTSFTLAVDRDFKGADGEKETDFIECVAWGNTAEFVNNYFAKGRMAVASGRLQVRNWTDKDGNKRKTAEVIADNVYFADSKPTEQTGYTGFVKNESVPPVTASNNFAVLDDDSTLPF